jgi:hypothetical protein
MEEGDEVFVFRVEYGTDFGAGINTSLKFRGVLVYY